MDGLEMVVGQGTGEDLEVVDDPEKVDADGRMMTTTILALKVRRSLYGRDKKVQAR